ncbi:MAG TPA: integrase arm-type DNA-binding domain-containing protein [Burkholderiales bacterium]|nr:integrase arm-type DNA-binding domain-containing protein [Burkholderiales bacterium]
MGKKKGTASWAEQQEKPKRGHADFAAPGSLHGLKLRVFRSGRRTWFIRGRLAGAATAARFVKLGDYHGVESPQSWAEERARLARVDLRNGLDPAQERQKNLDENKRQGMTFGALVAEHLVSGTAKLAKTTLTVRRLALNGPWLRDWHARPLAWITQGRINALQDQIPTTASYGPLSALRRVLGYAEDHGYIERAPKVIVPRAEGNAEPLFQYQEGGTPDFSELAAVLHALDVLEQQNPISPWPAIWRFACLTGARPGAVLGARWQEFDLSRAPTWTLPKERSKLRREISIPLSDAAADLLRAMRRPESGEGLVWPGRWGDAPRADVPGEATGLIAGLLAAKGFNVGFWQGRFRDTVASWLDTQPDASERAIALLLDHRAPAERSTRGRHYSKFQSDSLARTLANRWAATIEEARRTAAKAGPRVVGLAEKRKKSA